MTSFSPPGWIECPSCKEPCLDRRYPRDALMMPGRDWSDGWNIAHSYVEPLVRCPHCAQRFWSVDFVEFPRLRKQELQSAMVQGTSPASFPWLLRSDWASEVHALEEALGALILPLMDADPSPWFRDDKPPAWQTFVRSVPNNLETLSIEARRLFDRRIQAAQRCLWIDNHIDRNERIDAQVNRDELWGLEDGATRNLDAKRRPLAILIDGAMRSSSKTSRLLAAEYLRQGGWFQAAIKALEGFEPTRAELAAWAEQTRVLALLGLHAVVPRFSLR